MGVDPHRLGNKLRELGMKVIEEFAEIGVLAMRGLQQQDGQQKGRNEFLPHPEKLLGSLCVVTIR